MEGIVYTLNDLDFVVRVFFFFWRCRRFDSGNCNCERKKGIEHASDSLSRDDIVMRDERSEDTTSGLNSRSQGSSLDVKKNKLTGTFATLNNKIGDAAEELIRARKSEKGSERSSFKPPTPSFQQFHEYLQKT